LEWGKIKIPVAHYRRRNGLTKDIIIFLIAPTIFMGTMVRSPHGYKGGMGGTPPYSAERLAHRTRRNTRVRHCTLRGLVGIPTQSVKAINLTIFPFALSLSKGGRKNPTYWSLSRSWFDRLTTNGLS